MNPLAAVIAVVGIFLTTVFVVGILMRVMKARPKSSLPRARARRRRS